MRRVAGGYLVMWDKPGTRAAPGRFYHEIRELGGEVRFIQRSVYGVRTQKIALRLAELAGRYGLKVAIFLVKSKLPRQR